MDDFMRTLTTNGQIELQNLRDSIYLADDISAYTIECLYTPEWLRNHVWPPPPEWNITEEQAMKFISLVGGTVASIKYLDGKPQKEYIEDRDYSTDFTNLITITFIL